MSLESLVGPEGDLSTVTEEQCHKIRLRSPILQSQQFQSLMWMKAWEHAVLDATFPVDAGKDGLKQGLDRVCEEATAAVARGVKVLILSDSAASSGRVPISSAMVVGAVHHHLVRLCQRTRVVLVVDSGEAREVHHMCVLVGYGADAIYPREVFRTIAVLDVETQTACNKFVTTPFASPDTFVLRLLLCTLTQQSHFAYIPTLSLYTSRYVKALHKGMLKIMAKMGISTLQSYRGAQIFEAVGLSKDIVDRCFTGTASRIGGETLQTFSASSAV